MTQSGTTTATGRIRQATAADLPVIEWIEQRSFANPWPADTFQQYLDAAVFLVFEQPTGPLTGFILGDDLGPNTGGVGHIKDFAVAPQHRRQGIGRQLLAQALTRFAARGHHAVALEVRASNTAAQRLYRRFGFETVRTEHGYYRDGEDALVMLTKKPAAGTGT